MIIKCNTQILVDNFEYVTYVRGIIKNYNLENKKLEGLVEITGSYHDKEDNSYDFSKEEPFTIMFTNDHYQVRKVEIINLKTFEIVHSGIECHFDIKVEYDEYIEDENEFKETIIENESKIEEEITNKYEELLDDIFERNNNNENNIENSKPKENIIVENNISVVNNNESNKVSFTRIKERTQKINVFYITSESEIDRIVKNEQVGINNIYGNKLNKDYINKKRIIIEEK